MAAVKSFIVKVNEFITDDDLQNDLQLQPFASTYKQMFFSKDI
jgi:hypothetical protein